MAWGDSLGSRIQDAGNINTDPYSYSGFMGSITGKGLIAFPFKLSLMANSARTAASGIGYLSSINKHFDRKSLGYKYDSSHISGVMADTPRELYMLGKKALTNQLFLPGNSMRVRGRAAGKDLKNMLFGNHQSTGFFKDDYAARVGLNDSSSIFHSKGGKARYLSNGYKPGLKDRAFVSKLGVYDAIETMVDSGDLPSSLLRETEVKKFQTSIIRNMYGYNNSVPDSGGGSVILIQIYIHEDRLLVKTVRLLLLVQ